MVGLFPFYLNVCKIQHAQRFRFTKLMYELTVPSWVIHPCGQDKSWVEADFQILTFPAPRVILCSSPDLTLLQLLQIQLGRLGINIY